MHRKLLTVALIAGFGTAALAVGMCIVGMGDVRVQIDGIHRAANLERQTRIVIDQVNQSLVAFTTNVVDDLSPEERAEILAKTNVALGELRRSVADFEGSPMMAMLPPEHLEIFNKAIGSITHSWLELRDRIGTGIHPAEKVFHFLRILEDMDLIRTCLVSVQEKATATSTSEMSGAFEAIRDTIRLVVYIIAAAAVVAGLGTMLVVHYFRMFRRANAELAAANVALESSKRVVEDASRAKSEFLTNFSHELRTPLNAIIGFSGLLNDQSVRAVGGAENREHIAQINASGVHLLNLINDILDFSKVGAGKLQIAEAPFRLSRVVTQVASMFRARCAEAGQTLLVDMDETPVMLGDERRVKQILLNLASNAMKFTPAGGTITIGCDVDQGCPILFVRDTGIGIAAEDLPRVLAPFGQVESSLSRRFEGTGLGLPLVVAMAELHGGTLRLDSSPGYGTHAAVVFPAARLVELEVRREAVRYEAAA